MKKKVVIDIIFGVLLLIILFGIYRGFKSVYDNSQKRIETNKPITVYLVKNNKNETLKTYKNYMESIENVNSIVYNEGALLNCVVCVGERYDDISSTIYLSDEGEWKDVELKNMGNGQYLMEFIEDDLVSKRTVTCCVKANNSEGPIESYFSYISNSTAR